MAYHHAFGNACRTGGEVGIKRINVKPLASDLLQKYGVFLRLYCLFYIYDHSFKAQAIQLLFIL